MRTTSFYQIDIFLLKYFLSSLLTQLTTIHSLELMFNVTFRINETWFTKIIILTRLTMVSDIDNGAGFAVVTDIIFENIIVWMFKMGNFGDLVNLISMIKLMDLMDLFMIWIMDATCSFYSYFYVIFIVILFKRSIWQLSC